MISLDPHDLMNEIKDAEKLRKQHLDSWASIVGRLVGNKWRSNHKTDSTPENYPFGYIATMLPQLVWNNPVTEVTPDRAVSDSQTADGLEVALNHWIKSSSFRHRVLRPVVEDSLVGFGVTKTGIEERGDYGAGDVAGDFDLRPMMPYVNRIPPRNFIIDSQCGFNGGPSAARLVGHQFERDLEDLQKDQRYDPAATSLLTTMDVQTLRSDGEPFDQREARDSDRKRIALYELYLPEHGIILTLADRNGGVIIRQAKYYGPKEGPYTLWGFYIVPDQVYPLSPLVACWEQFSELQDHATAAAINAASHKVVGLYEAAAKSTVAKIKKAKSGELIQSSNPAAVKALELGGVSPQAMNYIEVLRERLDRMLGFSDAQRGVANSNTATANQLASQGANVRIDGMRQEVEECTSLDLRKVGWYMFHTEGVQMNASRQNPQTGQMEEGAFVGGPWQGGYVNDQYIPAEDPDMAWPDFALSIKPNSMSKEDDPLVQKRAQDEFSLTTTLAQLFMSAFGPQALLQFNWRRILDRMGRVFNERDYSKIIFVDQVGQMGMIPMDPLSMMGSQLPGQSGGMAGAAGAMSGAPPLQSQGMMGQMGMSQLGMGGMGSPSGSSMAPAPAPGFGALRRSPSTLPGLLANATGRLR